MTTTRTGTGFDATGPDTIGTDAAGPDAARPDVTTLEFTSEPINPLGAPARFTDVGLVPTPGLEAMFTEAVQRWRTELEPA
jgi:hypothetical protein